MHAPPEIRDEISDGEVHGPRPAERVTLALSAAALAVGPAAVGAALLAILPWVVEGLHWAATHVVLSKSAGGAVRAILPDLELPVQLLGFAVVLSTAIAGCSRIARWLALGASPFVDRAISAPLIAAGLAGTTQCALWALDGSVESGGGPAVVIPWLGVFCVYWALGSTFLARDGQARRTRRRLTIRDLSVALALAGLYAAALRWLVATGDLVEETAAATIAGFTAFFAVVGLFAFGIDLGCRFAARRRGERLLAAAAALACFGGIPLLVWSAFDGTGFRTLVVGLALPCVAYFVLSAALAVLTEGKAWSRRNPRVERAPSAAREPITLRTAAKACVARLFHGFWGIVRFLGGW